MTNKSGSTCSFPVRPPATRITWHGDLLPTRQVGGRGIVYAGWHPLRAIHTLRPGGKAAISGEWDNWCGRPHSYRPVMTIHLRFDRELTLAFPIGPHPSCATPGAPSTIKLSRPLLID